VGNRSRTATVSGVRFLTNDVLVAASLVGKRLFVIELDGAAGAARPVARVAGEIPATSGTSEVCVDLIDADFGAGGDDPGLGSRRVVAANCEHSTISLYRAVDRGSGWSVEPVDSRPVIAGGYCHGVAFVPGRPHLVATAVTTVHPGIHFVAFGPGAVPEPFIDDGWLPLSAAFTDDGSMVVVSRTVPIGPRPFADLRTKISLVRLGSPSGCHDVLDECELSGDETADGCSVHGSTLFAASQSHDSVFAFSVADGRVHRLANLEGFSFPHDVAVSPDGNWLAVANYGTSAISLRRLGPVDPAT
jgi:hypothetical protein